MFSSNKISQHNLNSNIQTQHCSSTAQFLHGVKTDHICHAQSSNYIAATHNITHSPCTSKCTTHPHHPPHYKKHKAYWCKWWQNGTRFRDGMKVLWCHSHLVWLVLRLPSLHALVFLQKTFSDLYIYGMYIFCICILPYLRVIEISTLYMSKDIAKLAMFESQKEVCVRLIYGIRRKEPGLETNVTGIIALPKALNKGRHG